MPEILSLGLPKTGTRTLLHCMRSFGYTHSGDAFQERRLLDWAIGNPVFDPEDVQDEPAFAFWDLLTHAAPHAKLICTVRDFEPWFRSCEWLRTPKRLGPKREQRIELERNLERSDLRPTLTRQWLFGLVGGGWAYERDAHFDVWAEHTLGCVRYVREHGGLVWDLTQDSSWDPLCAFLDRNVPDVPFPWINKTQRSA